jgi:ankyrin repeat protein
VKWIVLPTLVGVSLCLLPNATSALPNKEDFRLGGKTVHEAFADADVAELAKAACFGGAVEVSQQVKRATNPNATGLEGLTPLIWAVGCRNPAGAEALLKAGADANHRWPGGYTAVYAAAMSPAPQAAAILKLLIQYGGDPNTKDLRSGHSAIWEAMEVGMDTGNWGNWYALLDGGLDINRHDDSGDTIATEAAKLSQFDKVYELLDRGYKSDLEQLGRFVELSDLDADNPQAVWKKRVVERLRAAGVHFPP